MPVPQSAVSAPLADLDLELVSGSWPDGIAGEMVISAPEIRSELPFALFGFGALIRLSLRPGTNGAPSGRFALRHRVIDTPSKRLYDESPELFDPQPFGYLSPFGPPNQANTAPLPWGDRLFATWDVGRPVEVDPTDLRFLGEVGSRSSWGESSVPFEGVLPFFFSSAHPVVDPERDCLWTVKLMPTPEGPSALHAVRWDGRSTDVDVWPIDGATVEGSSHTVSQTRDWLVFADSGNFKTDLGEILGGERTATIDEGAPVYLVRKDALEGTPRGGMVGATRAAVAPTTGHFYGQWDDEESVRVVFEHMDLMDLGFRLQAGDNDANGRPIDPALVGFYNTAMAPNTLSEVTFDPHTGESDVTARYRDDTSFNLQLSAMDWSTEALISPTLHHVAYQGWRPGAVSSRALDLYRSQGRVGPLPAEDTPGRLVSFRRNGLEIAGSHTFEDTGDHITSPTFVPRPGTTPDTQRYVGRNPGGHDGWVVLPVLSDGGFRVEVFDAAAVSAGPVATLRAPGGACLPAMLHSAWMPTVDSPVNRDHLRFGDDLDPAALEALDEGPRAVLDAVVAGLA